ESISPSGEVEIAAGGEQAYTCSHVLNKVGIYRSEERRVGKEGRGEQTSNTVTVNVPAEQSFSIHKEQRLKGQSSYTSSELTGKLGETVEYNVVVKTSGNLPLKVSKLADSNSESISPSGEVEIAAGGEQAYTCSHVLNKVGIY